MCKVKKHLVKCIALSLTLAISGCTTLNPFYDAELASAKVDKASTIDFLNNTLVTVIPGTTINKVVEIYRSADIDLSIQSNLSVRDVVYTGPELVSFPAMDALDLITSYSVLDYWVSDGKTSVTITPSRFYTYTVSAQMKSSDWDILMDAVSAMLTVSLTNRSGDETAYTLGLALDDRLSHSVKVSAPLNTRHKIANFITEYTKQLNDVSQSGVMNNVQ